MNPTIPGPPATPPQDLPAAYADIELDNNAQRLPLLLCLDISSSMSGEPIRLLNEALALWGREIQEDVGLSSSVEIALVTFGGMGIGVWQGPHLLDPRATISPFVSAHQFRSPQLSASGVTLLTEAVETGMRLVAERKTELRRSGLQYYRPQICLVTDGLPTDSHGMATDAWRRLVPTLAAEQAAKRFRFYAFGIGGISDRGQQVLRELAPKYHATLKGFPFRDLLQTMSASASAEQQGAEEETFEQLFNRFKTQRSAWDA
ncbi:MULTISPECIES: vWA domain-containing protein [Streptomyces]|uniref:VWFA domain-containing protein n=1 Tax=Streptomyces phaeoluteigriseus TaxID=114686 RepID=A0A1V6MYI5_9ACTN|nr:MULTISPECIES: hypothetical protein [Streptomyces]OQD57363.1 hypothetical protein BM536_005175 [Streptomyces phaeoluteigriseus]UIX35033.1 hypothetical protein LUX31_36330 [Streptomyces sp. GQFP]